MNGIPSARSSGRHAASASDGWSLRSFVATLAGPLRGRVTPLTWLAFGAAALTAAYTLWSVRSPWGLLLAVGLPVLVLRLPVAGIVLVGVVGQEIKPNGRFELLTTLGSDVFFGPGKVPVILPLALTAALAAVARWWPERGYRLGRLELGLLGSAAGLAVLAVVVGLLHGQSLFSAVNQNGRPFVLLVLGLVIGASLRWLPGERWPLIVSITLALITLLLAALVAIPLGGSADPQLSRYFIYYDSAFPAIAAAVFIALLYETGRRMGWWSRVLIVATPLLVLISFRRSVWLAAAVASVVVFGLAWTRARAALLRLGPAVFAVSAIVVLAPGFLSDLGLRSTTSLATQAAPSDPKPAPSPDSPTPMDTSPMGLPSAPTSTTAKSTTKPDESAKRQADSTRGHVEDLQVGWDYVLDNFWTGVGPQSPQLKGLAAQPDPGQTSRVYVHNEFLQLWLRYGPGAVVLVLVLFAAAGLLALRAIRSPDTDVIVLTAAAFCAIAPICMMTAPFLSDTSRWPLLYGIAGGLLTLQSGRRPNPEVEVRA